MKELPDIKKLVRGRSYRLMQPGYGVYYLKESDVLDIIDTFGKAIVKKLEEDGDSTWQGYSHFVQTIKQELGI